MKFSGKSILSMAACVAVAIPTLVGCTGDNATPQPTTDNKASVISVKPQVTEDIINVIAATSGPNKGKLRCNPETSVPMTLKVGTSQTSQQMGGNAISSQLTDKGLEIFSGNVIPATSLIVHTQKAANIPQELQDQAGSQLSRSMLLPYEDWGRFDISDDIVLCRTARQPVEVPPAQPAPVQNPAGTTRDKTGGLICKKVVVEVRDLDTKPNQVASLDNFAQIKVEQVKDGLLITGSTQVIGEEVSSLLINNSVGTQPPATFGEENTLEEAILLTKSGYGQARTLTLCK